MDPSLPYGQLLVRFGDDPSFQAISSEDMLVANRDGLLAFRIHDADTCLGDNAGTLRVTVTGEGLSAVAKTPFFYCITGPGEGGGCMELYKSSVSTDPSSSESPPNWLTSQKAIECIGNVGTYVTIAVAIFNPSAATLSIALLPGGIESAALYNTFIEKLNANAPQLAETSGVNDSRWWIIVTRAAAETIADELTLKGCREWWSELDKSAGVIAR